MTLRTGRQASVEPGARTAFTLIELILVMTILTVVISVSAPSLAAFFHGRSLDSEARRLLALTRHGQSRAVSEGVPMVLWLDAPGGSYGLEEDQSYDERDPKAVEYTLDKELRIEVSNPAVQGTNRLRLPALRFLPDGSIDESSPETVRVLDAKGVALWVAQSRNRLSYEIRNKTNLYDQ